MWDILTKAGPVAVILGFGCYWLYRMYQAEKKEVARLNQLIIDLMKEHQADNREDQKSMINTVNAQTNAIKQLTYFLNGNSKDKKGGGN